MSPQAPRSKGQGGEPGPAGVRRRRAVGVSPPSCSAGVPAPSAPGSLQNRAARLPRGSPRWGGGQPMAGCRRHPGPLHCSLRGCPSGPSLLSALCGWGSPRGHLPPGSPQPLSLQNAARAGGWAGSPPHRSRSRLLATSPASPLPVTAASAPLTPPHHRHRVYRYRHHHYHHHHHPQHGHRSHYQRYHHH